MKIIKIIIGFLSSIICGSLLVWINFLGLLDILSGFRKKIFAGPQIEVLIFAVLISALSLLLLIVVVRKLNLAHTWAYYLLFVITLIISTLFVRTINFIPDSYSPSLRALADVRQLASALELYHNDKNTYPSQLNDLQPAYVGLVGNRVYPKVRVCPQKQAIISYKPISQNSYALQFCLEEEMGSYGKGIHWLTEEGIK